MSNKLKCPICGGDIQYDNSYSTYDCKNNPSEHYASEEVWQALTQARLDLEIARKALKNMSLGNVPSLPDDETLANAMCNYARDTLKQIEHKE